MGEQNEQGLRSKHAVPWTRYVVRTIIVLLPGLGLLPYETFLCVMLFSLYIFFISRYAFPKQQGAPTRTPPFLEGRKALFASYTKLAACIGLYFPFGYIILGLAFGLKEIVHTAAPHTFLLAFQILSERLSSSLSPPCLALVPILYNSGRMVSIWAWLQIDFSSAHVSSWVIAGRVLAIANLLLWSYNLFGFLLPLYVPFCFRAYFEFEKA